MVNIVQNACIVNFALYIAVTAEETTTAERTDTTLNDSPSTDSIPPNTMITTPPIVSTMASNAASTAVPSTTLSIPPTTTAGATTAVATTAGVTTTGAITAGVTTAGATTAGATTAGATTAGATTAGVTTAGATTASATTADVTTAGATTPGVTTAGATTAGATTTEVTTTTSTATTSTTTVTTTACPYSVCVTAECNSNIAAKAAAISSVPSTTLYPGNLALSYLNGTYYYIEKSKTMNWFDALTFCRTNGMDLTKIESQEEQDALNAELTKLQISGSVVYTSGNKIGPICPYTWVDGSDLTYKNWATNEPSQSTSENCLIILNKVWVDLFCSAGAYFICEAPANAAITTTTPCPYSKCLTAECNSNIAAKAAAISSVPATTLYPGNLALSYLNGTYYYIEKSKTMNWFDALVFCRTNGMDLTKIDSQEEQDVLNAELTRLQISGSWVYTSGNKIGPICPYTWVDGSDLTYKNWATNEPSQSTSENCLIIVNKVWVDLFCSAGAYFICEAPANAAITTTTPCPYSNCTTGQCNQDVLDREAAIKAVPSTTLYPATLPLTYLNGQYYYFEKGRALTWFAALTFCRTNGMDLVKIDSQAEQDAINAELTRLNIIANYVHTSGNKIGPKCPYTWEDGSPLTYKYWQPAEPSQSLYENCLITWQGKWWDLPCAYGTYFICEQLPGQTITTTAASG